MLEVVEALVEAVGETLARAVVGAVLESEDPARAAEAAVAHLAAQEAARKAVDLAARVQTVPE